MIFVQCARHYLRVLAFVALNACVVPVFAAEPDSGIRLHPALAGIDWTQATEVEVLLEDHAYKPDLIQLKRGQAYKIILKNVGGVSHDMVGGSLFQESVIALRMLSSSVGRVVADSVSSVYVRPKHQIEIWLVPLKEGEYSYFCSLTGHRDEGMEGVVQIVP